MCSSDSCTAYNRDSDGDGHGGPKTTSYCGEPPPGYVSNGDDCCESDPNAYPGQTTYFRLPNACNDYDYNCDGSESKRYPIRGSCGTSPLCLQINGWGTATIPACGGFGQLIEDCVAEQRRCTTLVGGYTWQTCR